MGDGYYEKVIGNPFSVALVLSFSSCGKKEPADSIIITNDVVSQEQQSEIDTSSEQEGQIEASSSSSKKQDTANPSSDKKALLQNP